jgi:hypothetical protein
MMNRMKIKETTGQKFLLFFRLINGYASYISWLAIFLFAAVGFILILTNRNPIPLRPIGIALRYSFAIVLLCLSILFTLIYFIRGWVGWLLSIFFTFAVYALSLVGVWSSGHSGQYYIASLLPWVDANHYYTAALSALDGGLFNAFASRRPINSALLATLLGLSGRNLQISVAILAAMVAGSVYIAAREIQRTHGLAAGVITAVLFFFFYRRFSGTTMTESLGLALGALSLAVLWRGASAKKPWLVIFGVFLMTLGLNVRPGAMIILPGLVLWAAWIFRGEKAFSWRYLVLSSIAVAAGFLINSLIFWLFAAPGSAQNASMSFFIYEMAFGGGNWGQFMVDHPEVLKLSEQAMSVRLTELALNQIITHPVVVLQSIMSRYGPLFSFGSYSAYSYLGGENALATLISRIIISMLSLSGLGRLLWNWRDPHNALMLVSTIGILLSVPVVPPGNEEQMRYYAVSIPILAFLAAIGAAFYFEKLKLSILGRGNKEALPINLVVGYSAFLIISIVSGAAITKLFVQSPHYQEINCPSEYEAAYVRLDPGSSVNIIKEDVFKLDWLPDFHQGRFRWYVHDMSQNDVINELEKLEAPMTIFTGMELKSGNEIWVFVNSNLLPKTNGIIGLCGKWRINTGITGARFFYASSVQNVTDLTPD